MVDVIPNGTYHGYVAASLDTDKLRELRVAAQLSQGQLSLRAGLARNAVSRIEKGLRGEDPSYNTVVSLADALGVKPEILIARPSEHDWRFG